MAKSINRYFQFVSSAKEAKPSGRLWYPAADVYETEEGWMVKVELAGVSAEDVELEIMGNVLSISGCRKDRTCSQGMSYQQMEITYSQFQKDLTFPASIEGARVEHNFQDGLLIIFLRKA
ncbi:MAG: Hsp20/alpha crystallin family protein [Pyrinomonadaceae bacterium]